MSVPISIAVDATTLTRAGTILPLVQATVPAADLPYTWTGLARYGLNKFHYRLGKPDYVYTAADFTPSVEGDANVGINLEDDDNSRVNAISAALGVGREEVAGAAVCTGAAAMLGADERVIGPFYRAP